MKELKRSRPKGSMKGIYKDMKQLKTNSHGFIARIDLKSYGV